MPGGTGTDATACRSCGAAIVWAVNTRTGKRGPIDAEPSPDGNVVLTTDDDGVLRYDVLADPAERQGAADAGIALYVSHFLTCPHRESWQTSKPKARTT